MATFNVNTFRSDGLTYGGVFPSLFDVQITNPWIDTNDKKTRLLIKAASLPASTLGTIEAPYKGRKIKYAGNRTYESWTVTVLNDEDFKLRDAFEKWHNAINSAVNNRREFATSSPLEYKSQAIITQYSKTEQPIKYYKFDGIYPSNIGAIETNWETTDAIEEYTVELQYDWFYSSNSIIA